MSSSLLGLLAGAGGLVAANAELPQSAAAELSSASERGSSAA